MVGGDIGDLARRMPLGRLEDREDFQVTVDIEPTGNRWSPFWALLFIGVAGLLSWGAISILIYAIVD